MMQDINARIHEHYEHVCKKECRKYINGECNRRIVDCMDDHK
jgi:hypothetical protein